MSSPMRPKEVTVRKSPKRKNMISNSHAPEPIVAFLGWGSARSVSWVSDGNLQPELKACLKISQGLGFFELLVS